MSHSITMNHAHLAAIAGAALFVILSSSLAYRLTSIVAPTQRYGCPTRLGLILHAFVFAILFALIEPHI